MSKSVVFVILLENAILDYLQNRKFKNNKKLPLKIIFIKNSPIPFQPPIRARDVTFWFSDNFESAIIVRLIARLPDSCLIVDLSNEKQTFTLKQWYDSPTGFKIESQIFNRHMNRLIGLKCRPPIDIKFTLDIWTLSFFITNIFLTFQIDFSILIAFRIWIVFFVPVDPKI